MEHFFNCPYCGAGISMILEIMAGPQQYIEDCEVCRNPIEISYSFDEGELTSFQAISIEQ